jgi:putative glutamine amidotransferase
MTTAARPLVLVPACLRSRDGHDGFWVDRKYLDAVRLAGAEPWIIAAAAPDDVPALLDRADGVLLTGSPSNIEPHHYREAALDPTQPVDPLRDAWVLPLVRAAVARGTPLFGICRGLQEVNVALGGTLAQALPPGGLRHHAEEGDIECLYAATHGVDVAPGGVLERLLDGRGRFDVNSIHVQGIARLAPGLRVEAHAPDGVVEAVSTTASNGFLLAVQWHPEWRAAENDVSRRLLQAFGAACLQRRAGR